MQKTALIIAGPTAVGKTYFAETLALESLRTLGKKIEIVNMDVGQMYTPLSIGTAKPSWHHNPIPHHLFDILNNPSDYTVVAYREKIIETLHAIWERDALPILVGGSSFYLKSLLFPPQAKLTHNSNDDFITSEKTINWQDLQEIDPVRASKIHPHDEYRIQRAYAIWQNTESQPSLLQPAYNPFCQNYQIIYLTRDRAELYERINQRVLVMIQEGLENEVRNLIDTPWETFLLRKKLIGYDDMIHYLRHHYTLNQAIASIQKRSRNYAKRQETFIRGIERDLKLIGQHKIEMVNLTLSDVDLYIKQLLYKITNV